MLKVKLQNKFLKISVQLYLTTKKPNVRGFVMLSINIKYCNIPELSSTDAVLSTTISGLPDFLKSRMTVVP